MLIVHYSHVEFDGHHATGKSPFYMVYGTEPKLPDDKVLPIINDDELNSVSIRTQQFNQLL